MSNKVVGFVAKSDQRKMADRIGDADNFRTAKRITDNGVVTMRTQGRLRSRFDLEEDERKRVAVPVPTLTEIDLSGAATQADRLYYHSDPQDELRIWSSDGLLSMAVTPLQRIIFKTSAITPAAQFSLWLCNEDEDGTQSAPVVAGDVNPAAQEVTGSRTFHNETYVYPRNDTLADYSPLKGIGFALKRIAGISALLDGVQYTFSFAGFDQAQQPVVALGLAECPTPIEQNFAKRKYSTSGVKQIATVPARIKLAEPGGLLPFAKHSIALSAKEHSGDAAVVRPINDLCRVEAFGQPWHGHLRNDHELSTRALFESQSSSNILFGAPGVVSVPYGSSWFKRYSFANSAPATIDSKQVFDTVTFIDGYCSPLRDFPIKLLSDEFNEEFLCESDGKIYKLKASLEFDASGPGANYIVISKVRRVDDFLENSDTSKEELLRRRIYLKFGVKDPLQSYIQFGTKYANFKLVIKRGDSSSNDHLIYIFNNYGQIGVRANIAWYGIASIVSPLDVTLSERPLGDTTLYSETGFFDPHDSQSGTRYLWESRDVVQKYKTDYQSTGSGPVPGVPGSFQHLETTYSGEYYYLVSTSSPDASGQRYLINAIDIVYSGSAWEFIAVGTRISSNASVSSTMSVTVNYTYSKIGDVPIVGYDDYGNAIPGYGSQTQTHTASVSGSYSSTSSYSGSYENGLFRGADISSVAFVSGVTKNLKDTISDSASLSPLWSATGMGSVEVMDGTEWSNSVGVSGQMPSFTVYNGSYTPPASQATSFLGESSVLQHQIIDSHSLVPSYKTIFSIGIDAFDPALIPNNWSVTPSQYPYASFVSSPTYGVGTKGLIVFMQGISEEGDGYLLADGVLTNILRSEMWSANTNTLGITKTDEVGYIF